MLYLLLPYQILLGDVYLVYFINPQRIIFWKADEQKHITFNGTNQVIYHVGPKELW